MGKKRTAHGHDTFAEIVGGVTAASPDSTEAGYAPIYSPIDEGKFTDKHGVSWQLRDDDLLWARIQHLILDNQVPLLYAYLGEVTQILDEDRADFLTIVRPYLERPHFPPPAVHSDFTAAEFNDDQHRSLLIIEETS